MKPALDRRKLKHHPLPPEQRPTLLACGHETAALPVVTGAKTLFLCPSGCGLQRARRRRGRVAAAGVFDGVRTPGDEERAA